MRFSIPARTPACLLVLSILLVTGAKGQDSAQVDTVPIEAVARSNYQDLEAYRGQPEKPLWYFIDSLEQISLREPEKAPNKPNYQVTTQNAEIGLLAGFEVTRVDYAVTFKGFQPVPGLHQGTLVLMEIWPGLYKLVAAYGAGDAPDSSKIVYPGGQECLGMFWVDRTAGDVSWTEYWTWDWPTEGPKNLAFARQTTAALDSILPPGFYCRYAGYLSYDSLSLAAPVYRPTDDFGKPTGGEARVSYRIDDNTFVVTDCRYQPSR